MGRVVTQHCSDGGWRLPASHPVQGRLAFLNSVILFSTAMSVVEPSSSLAGT